MPDFQLKTPVAFIIFNRPDTTERVFAEIAKAKPPRLLVIGDGAREDRPGEAERVAVARSTIDKVDWDCEVLTNFSDVNLGCKQRVSTGITWVFENIEEAIILEDDCLPDPTFFRFCEELLERYRDDKRIGMISGDNFQFGRHRTDDSYYFSKYAHIWGWASWRDRWMGSYDVAMTQWLYLRDRGAFFETLESKAESKFWRNIFDRTYRGEIDTWDYQWTFANWAEGRLSILPTVNLISNIGFGNNATHTNNTSIYADMAVEPIEFPLSHPEIVLPNNDADSYTSKNMFLAPLKNRFFQQLCKLIR